MTEVQPKLVTILQDFLESEASEQSESGSLESRLSDLSAEVDRLVSTTPDPRLALNLTAAYALVVDGFTAFETLFEEETEGLDTSIAFLTGTLAAANQWLVAAASLIDEELASQNL